MKRKNKIHNILLSISILIDVIIFMVSVASLDGISYLPFYTTLISLAYMILVIYANDYM